MSRKTRKLIWSAPLVAVLAVAGALVIFVALGPNGAQANHVTIPGAPTDLTVELGQRQRWPVGSGIGLGGPLRQRTGGRIPHRLLRQ